jgi:hypothetical protein
MTNKPWTCDRCVEAVKIGDLVYAAVTNHVKRTMRHANCHVGVSLDELRDSVESANKAADRALDRLKRLRDMTKVQR